MSSSNAAVADVSKAEALAQIEERISKLKSLDEMIEYMNSFIERYSAPEMPLRMGPVVSNAKRVRDEMVRRNKQLKKLKSQGGDVSEASELNTKDMMAQISRSLTVSSAPPVTAMLMEDEF